MPERRWSIVYRWFFQAVSSGSAAGSAPSAASPAGSARRRRSTARRGPCSCDTPVSSVSATSRPSSVFAQSASSFASSGSDTFVPLNASSSLSSIASWSFAGYDARLTSSSISSSFARDSVRKSSSTSFADGETADRPSGTALRGCSAGRPRLLPAGRHEPRPSPPVTGNSISFCRYSSSTRPCSSVLDLAPRSCPPAPPASA